MVGIDMRRHFAACLLTANMFGHDSAEQLEAFAEPLRGRVVRVFDSRGYQRHVQPGPHRIAAI